MIQTPTNGKDMRRLVRSKLGRVSSIEGEAEDLKSPRVEPNGAGENVHN